MRPWVPLAALALALSPLALLHPARVTGRSMQPTLPDGTIVWVLRAWAAGEPKPGEIWLAQGPEGPVIKRVLAGPGMRLETPSVPLQNADRSGPWEAGSGYLVLGDNRTASRDSRVWGPLPREAFQGRVLHSSPAASRSQDSKAH